MLNFSILTTLVILSATAPQVSADRHPDAICVFDCQFDRPWDANFDNWPDNWRRVLGEGLPHYVDIGIVDDDAANGNACLMVDVDGGGGHVESPLVAVSDDFSYKAECRLRLVGLASTRVQVRVDFYDDDDQLLQSEATQWLSGTRQDQWIKLHIGPVNPERSEITAARLVLHVEPGKHVDLSGKVMLDDVWMARLPRMTVSTGDACNVYTDPGEIEITCSLSGILESDPDIHFELLDASSKTLGNSRVQLEGQLITERRRRASDFVGVTETHRAAYAGSTSWQPPIVKHGFYKVRVSMLTARGMMDQRIVNVALAPPLERLRTGEFGWSLAGDQVPLSLEDLGQLLPRVAVHWVKLPVWYNEDDPARGEELSRFADRASANHIKVVGVIDRPPRDSELGRRLPEDASIADIFNTDATGWMPLLEPVLTRLSLRVQWWQLGGDHDASLSRVGNLEPGLASLRDKLFRFGQDVSLGFGWKWIQSQATSDDPPWQFQQFATAPALTGQELAEYLQLPAPPKVARWVLVEPLSTREYDLETRARDLVEQMLAAKIHRAQVIFAAKPFDDDHGLMTTDGMPGEMLLPWRTTASLLSGATYLGSIELQNGSANRLFQRPTGDVLMVVWNDAPTEEVIPLGDELRVLDVWGRAQQSRPSGDRLVIDVEPMPRFVLGLNASVARWGMAVKFKQLHVPSVFGKAHSNGIELTNAFNQGVGGTVELSAPKGWQITPQRIDFKLAAGETVVRPFEISLPFDATSGAAPLRADFSVDADRMYRFSVDRELIVGDGLVQIETATRLEDDGTLIIEQRMLNNSPALVDFKCLLYAPGRRRQRTQVFRLGASPDTKVYRYPHGSQLLGAELWLRAEEVNGSRVLNHRFVVVE